MGSVIEYPTIAYVVFGAMAFVYLFFYKRLSLRGLKNNLKRMKKAGKLPYPSNTTITFFEDYFFEKTDTSETKMSYLNVEHVDDSDMAVYIYTGAISAYIVPNRAFKDSEERARLFVICRQRLPSIIKVGKITRLYNMAALTFYS